MRKKKGNRVGLRSQNKRWTKRKSKKRRTKKRINKKRITKKYKQRGGVNVYGDFHVECDSDIYSNEEVKLMLETFETIYKEMNRGLSVTFDKVLFDNFVKYIRKCRLSGELPRLIKSDDRYLKWLPTSGIDDYLESSFRDNAKRISEMDLLDAQNCGHRAYLVCQRLEIKYGNMDIFSGIVTVYNSDPSKLKVPHSSNPKIFSFCEKNGFIYFVDFASNPPHIIIDKGSIDMVEIRAKLMEPYGITDIQNITWRTYYDNDNEIYTGSLNPVISTYIGVPTVNYTQPHPLPSPSPHPSP